MNLLLQGLINKGYENIRIYSEDKDLYLAYENRIYRYEIDALKEIFSIVTPFADDYQKLILVPENRKTALVTISANVNDCKEYLNGVISARDFAGKLLIEFNCDDTWNKLKNQNEYNSSNTRFDITLRPSVKFLFGPYEDPVLYQLNLNPGLQTSFWKGMSFNYEMIVPLHNDMLNREDSVRTGLVVLNQSFRLPSDFFVSASAGYFYQDRYGFDFEARKYYLNGDLNIDLDLGLTGFATFAGTHLYYNDRLIGTGSISLEYRVPAYDLTLGIMAGKFLGGDESFRVDINREFGEIEIGFFAIRSNEGVSNGGINVTIPLFPSTYFRPNVVRVRPDKYFSWSYLVRTDLKYLIGTRYNTGSRLNIFNKKLNPEFIKNNFWK